MHSALLLALVLITLTATAALLQKAHHQHAYKAKPLMSAPELEAYRRLRQALPSALICPQVQLCRFITADHLRDRRWHYRIAQLSADFTVCDSSGRVLAVIEIDDRSHERDAQRRRDYKKDKACESAGIPLIRWQARRLPTLEQMHSELCDLDQQRKLA